MAEFSRLNGYDVKDKRARQFLDDSQILETIPLFHTTARSYYYEGQEINFTQALNEFDYLVIHYDSYNYNPADDDDPTNTKQIAIETALDLTSGTSFSINDTFMDSEYEYLNCNTMTLLVADNTFKKLRIVESIKGAIKMQDGTTTYKEWTQANGGNTYAFGICLRDIEGIKLKSVSFQ